MHGLEDGHDSSPEQILGLFGNKSKPGCSLLEAVLYNVQMPVLSHSMCKRVALDLAKRNSLD